MPRIDRITLTRPLLYGNPIPWEIAPWYDRVLHAAHDELRMCGARFYKGDIMRYTFNKRTLLAQFDKELVRALRAARTMTDYELEAAYAELYVVRAITQSATMSRIIGVVWDIYGAEISRRQELTRARLLIEETIDEMEN